MKKIKSLMIIMFMALFAQQSLQASFSWPKFGSCIQTSPIILPKNMIVNTPYLKFYMPSSIQEVIAAPGAAVVSSGKAIATSKAAASSISPIMIFGVTFSAITIPVIKHCLASNYSDEEKKNSKNLSAKAAYHGLWQGSAWYLASKCSSNEKFQSSCMVLASLCAYSIIKGFDNSRIHDKKLRELERDYGIDLKYAWYDQPGEWCKKIVCYNEPAMDNANRHNSLNFIKTVKEELRNFENHQKDIWSCRDEDLVRYSKNSNNNQSIISNQVSGLKTAAALANETLSVAEGHFIGFHCESVQALRDRIKHYKDKIKVDFEYLKVQLSNFDIKNKIPNSRDEFTILQQVNVINPHRATMSFALGAFGFSGFYNSQRVYELMLLLAEINIYITKLDSLFKSYSPTPGCSLSMPFDNLPGPLIFHLTPNS